MCNPDIAKGVPARQFFVKCLYLKEKQDNDNWEEVISQFNFAELTRKIFSSSVKRRPEKLKESSTFAQCIVYYFQ